ncbi:unnamed protein product [Ceratitis capitata]|uniref:(Mediterranean fruit fly) hypothetical protein n=1 Tax=Ceratitis capitata TaxID=7213 RepID=A0A811V431_CERCA|nr:unnamed protein product [Ceratitis capitata]
MMHQCSSLLQVAMLALLSECSGLKALCHATTQGDCGCSTRQRCICMLHVGCMQRDGFSFSCCQTKTHTHMAHIYTYVASDTVHMQMSFF